MTMKNKNLETYYSYCEVPKEAKTQITGGRLKGMTYINPQWRIEALTALFGQCGIGWYYDIVSVDYKDGSDKTVLCIVLLKFYYKIDKEQWSAPIIGSGGSSMISNEKNGLYTNNECLKMAITDALSVVCKQLWIGANVYWNKENTKYTEYPFDEKETHIQTNIDKPKASQIDKVIKLYSNMCDLEQECFQLFNKNIYDINSSELISLIKKIKKNDL